MEQHNNPGPGLLDDVQPAPGFDLDGLIEEAAGTPKQQYDAAFTDPEIPTDDGPVPTGAAQAKARRAAANMLMLMIDRAQAGIFTLFGAKGHAEEFRFNKADRAEMATYLEEGLPDDFKLPWWVGFSVLFIAQTAANVGKLQDIRAERKRQQQEEAAKEREQRMQQEREEEAIREQRRERERQHELRAIEERKRRDAELKAQVDAEYEEREREEEERRPRRTRTTKARSTKDRRAYMKEYNAKRAAERRAAKAAQQA